jgi:hypothetical protein
VDELFRSRRTWSDQGTGLEEANPRNEAAARGGLWIDCLPWADLGLTKGRVTKGRLRKVRHAFVASFGVALLGSPATFATGRDLSVGDGTGLKTAGRKGGHWSNSSWSK